MQTNAYNLTNSIGQFTMQKDDAGAWRVYFGAEELGSYPTPETAAKELAAGDACWPNGIDPSTLGLPAELSAWEPIR